MVSNTPFVVPDPPLLNPIIPNGATAAQITELTCQHAAETRVFNEYPYVETALQKQLIDSIEPLFLDAEQDQDDPSVCVDGATMAPEQPYGEQCRSLCSLF
jgi:hypothetical protein